MPPSPGREQVGAYVGLGDRIRARLARLAASPTWLVNESRLARQTVYRALTRDEATVSVLRRLAETLRIDVRELTGWTDDAGDGERVAAEPQSQTDGSRLDALPAYWYGRIEEAARTVELTRAHLERVGGTLTALLASGQLGPYPRADALETRTGPRPKRRK